MYSNQINKIYSVITRNVFVIIIFLQEFSVEIEFKDNLSPEQAFDCVDIPLVSHEHAQVCLDYFFLNI